MNYAKCILMGAFVLGSFLSHAQVKNGDMAPSFSLKGESGKTYDLSKDKGKYVILEWYNDGCPYVKKHYNAGNMQALQSEFTGKKINEKEVVWYSVISSKKGSQGYVDAKGAQDLMKERKSKPTAILLDDGKVGKAYGATTTPHMFIIDPDGKVVYQGAIDDQPSANKKTLEGAKNYVKLAFADIEAGKPVQMASTQPYGCSVKY